MHSKLESPLTSFEIKTFFRAMHVLLYHMSISGIRSKRYVARVQQ